MNARHARWFLSELDGLLARELLTPETAHRLRDYYTEKAAGRQRLSRELVLGIFGAILIGGGIILLLAHNWTDLARPVRALLALLPVALSLTCAGYALSRKAASAAWRESTATALTLAVAAAIALISQTYHLGDLDFLLAWALLTLPVIYVLQAVVPATLYLAISLSWVHVDGSTLGYWLLMAAIVPFLVTFFDRQRSDLATFLGWCVAFSLPLGVGMSFGNLESTWLYSFSFLFAFMALEGLRASKNVTSSRILGPLAFTGTLGVMGLALFLTFKALAKEIVGMGFQIPYEWADGHIRADEVTMWLLLAALLGRVVRVWASAWNNLAAVPVLLGCLPVLVLATMGSPGDEIPVVVLFNVYLAALSLAVVAKGLRAGHGGWTHLGLTGFSILVIARFFESELPLTLRGLAFVVVGVAFLAVNRALARRNRQEPGQPLSAALGEAS